MGVFCWPSNPHARTRARGSRKMKTNSTRTEIKSRLPFDIDPLLDDDFDGLEDIFTEDLIPELGNDAQWIPNPSTS